MIGVKVLDEISKALKLVRTVSVLNEVGYGQLHTERGSEIGRFGEISHRTLLSLRDRKLNPGEVDGGGRSDVNREQDVEG